VGTKTAETKLIVGGTVKTAATEINIKEFIIENKRDRIMCLDEVNLNKFKNISSCNRE
jgi:hypothetical protein